MANRLADAISPYLRSHADNPVNWFEWGADAFAEASARDVPVLVSIGYSTCHWCHVMARETFSDPDAAAVINDGFVAIKVDREEHPDVDSSYLAAAGAFTEQLGWPLNVFVTPAGKAFYAGTYFPPTPMVGHPSFLQVLEAVTDAWVNRRDEVSSNADLVASALVRKPDDSTGALPSDFSAVVAELAGYEDSQFGGFGGAPKFPVAPIIKFLLDAGSTGFVTSAQPAESTDRPGSAGSLASTDARALAIRTLDSMAASNLRDGVEGGFFRYSTRRDWTEPHYERMLYDNSMLLAAYSRVSWGAGIASGIASFLSDVMAVDGGFASAQDSESTIDGQRNEGGYYRFDAASRAQQQPPALDRKVLTGWNGLAIQALADAGFRLSRADWVDAARFTADRLLGAHVRADGSLVRASIDGRTSSAVATLEDFGMFASGLLRLALATGEVLYAERGRALVDACLAGKSSHPFAVPGGADPVLVAQGLALDTDPSEGAYPSGLSAIAEAARILHVLTGQRHYFEAASAAMRGFAVLAPQRPLAFGAALSVMSALARPITQLVVVGEPDTETSTMVRGWDRAGSVVAVVTDSQARAFAESGFDLFTGRISIDGRAAAYLCNDFVCRLPVTDAGTLGELLAAQP